MINKTSLNRPNNLQATNCDVFVVVRLDIFVAAEGKQWIVVMSRVSLTDDWRRTPAAFVTIIPPRVSKKTAPHRPTVFTGGGGGGLDQ